MSQEKLIFISVLIMVVLLTGTINAQEEEWIGYAGINYNIYSELDLSGIGFYGGAKNLTIKDYSFGWEVELLDYSREYTTEYIYDNPNNNQTYQAEDDYQAFGLLGTFTYEFNNFYQLENFNVYSKAGFYQISLNKKLTGDNTTTSSSDENWEFGAKIGVGVSEMVKKNLILNARLGYRMVDDFKGFESGLKMIQKF
ncbi:hypothetical protein [Halanaerobacter jeridensis]|uniref:Outer membrane protein beta-barrel domain-containing protein n=1 Tax=Halanaerobacter jeridensis TaxID=706427 RepID=A0A939BPN2_9FIRM|nr:hypothetical protein [Halanaerobacter jeridensis]MBM7557078.1 hypothetical protein [Halanaerobacter jeridensis]